MDLYIYKGNEFLSTGILDFKFFQKSIISVLYIPYKSGHVSHTIKNYVLGEIKRYIRYNSLKITFLKTRTKFFSRLRNRGFKKVWLRRIFSLVQYEDRSKLMHSSHSTIPEFQVVPETEAESLVVRDSERILKESGYPRLCFNPGSNEMHTENRLGPNILVPQDPLTLGGGTISTDPSNIFVRNSSLTSLNGTYFPIQESRRTAAAAAAAIPIQKMGTKWERKHHR